MMNPIIKILYMIPIVSSLVFDINTIKGRWYQTYSNRFVQETDEISFNCVTIDVDVNGNQLHIYKRAYLHNDFGDMVSYNYSLFPVLPTKQQLIDEHNGWALAIFFNSTLHKQRGFQLREINPNYILWTETTEPSIYVWTRDFLQFKMYDDWKTLARYNYWKYNDYYETPIPSYDYLCLAHPFSHE